MNEPNAAMGCGLAAACNGDDDPSRSAKEIVRELFPQRETHLREIVGSAIAEPRNDAVKSAPLVDLGAGRTDQAYNTTLLDMGRRGSTAVAGIAAIAWVAASAFACGTAGPPATPSSPQRSSAMPIAPAVTAAPPTAPPEPVLKAGPPLRVIDDFDREPLLHVLGDHVPLISTGQELFWIHPGNVTADPRMIEGLPEPGGVWRIARVAGKWPDSVWLEVVEGHGVTGRSVLYRWRDKRWQQTQAIPGGKTFVGIAAWSSDRLLGVIQSRVAFDAAFRLVQPPNGVMDLQFTQPEKAASFCKSRMRAEVFTALPSGHVFVGGIVCETAGNDATAIGAGVERWHPGDNQGMIDMLPGMDIGSEYDAVSVNALVARSPDEVYVAVERLRNAEGSLRDSRLVRFDGKEWSVVPTPLPGGVTNLWLGEALWAADGEGQPWKFTIYDTWVRQELLPAMPGSRTTSIWHPGGDFLVAVVSRHGRWYVMHAAPKVNRLLE